MNDRCGPIEIEKRASYGQYRNGNASGDNPVRGCSANLWPLWCRDLIAVQVRDAGADLRLCF